MSDKLPPAKLYEALKENNVGYFCGVPDSSLSSFGHYLGEIAKESHDIAVNEGSAIGLAIGYHIATAKVPLVYMQNSGLGNAVNPLLSLTDPLVMGIPIILFIGWRGQPGIKDEPQHIKQGLVTVPLLDSLGIPHEILCSKPEEVAEQIARAVSVAAGENKPFALLVQDGTLEPYKAAEPSAPHASLTREEAVKLVADKLGNNNVIVATTGKTSRELFEYREGAHHGHDQDLLIVGGMGHASSIAFGIAKQKPGRKVFVIDGDGALLMHMGSLAFIGNSGLKNFYHIVINNGAHESVGGQPTVARDMNLSAIAKTSGYRHVQTAADYTSLETMLDTLQEIDGPVFVELKTNAISRPDLTRPTVSPSDNKKAFMKFLEQD